MKNEDLKITELDGIFSVVVSGRANFEYAVPLRAMAEKLTSDACVQFDMENCETMDSTFMGVLTMLALKSRKNGTCVMLINAGNNLVRLLNDLGVAKLFKFVSSNDDEPDFGDELDLPESGGLLDTAETVAEAHRTLAEADAANAERFGAVIEFAEKDVERLRGEKK